MLDLYPVNEYFYVLSKAEGPDTASLNWRPIAASKNINLVRVHALDIIGPYTGHFTQTKYEDFFYRDTFDDLSLIMTRPSSSDILGLRITKVAGYL